MIAMLVLETLMIGVFVALDLVLFYLFFEAGLIPMFLIIGIWGGQGPDLRILQVLPLHLPRLRPDAGRDDRDVRGCGHDGYRQLLAHQFSTGTIDLAGLADRGRDAVAGCGSPSSRVSR
jgi:NADH-quinone oxidoreductase subunit M